MRRPLCGAGLAVRARMNAQKLLMLVVLVLTACGGEVFVQSDDGLDSAELALLQLPADEAQLVLVLVNSPVTTAEVLRYDIKLDSRAAANIVHRRSIRLFTSMMDLTSVAYVKDAALTKLRDWAVAHVPAAETVKGVAFTPAQIMVVLAGINGASLSQLDIEAGLDARAAQNLIAARPFASIAAVGGVAQVGTVALTKLRDFFGASVEPTVSLAGTFDGVYFDEETAEVALELANTIPYGHFSLQGITPAPAAAIVNGRPHATLKAVADTAGVGTATMRALHTWASKSLTPAVPATPAIPTVPVGTAQDGDECTAQAGCAAGLVCNGLTIWEVGFCRPEWMRKSFTNNTQQNVPDFPAAGTQSTILVSGLASVPEDVVIDLNITHERIEDLLVTIEQPNTGGLQGVLWTAGVTGSTRIVAPLGVEYDNMVNGEWTLTVTDTKGQKTGALVSWTLHLSSRYD